ncbi:MAG: hypothetical protein KHZ96_07545 [Coprobacillus sp.]|nr:hypothetical protein [Coprobacillus sp.]
MKIEYNIQTTVENIKIGESFLYQDELYMKIDEDGVVKTDNRFPNLVINLNDNKLNSFDSSVLVYKVESKIVVG